PQGLSVWGNAVLLDTPSGTQTAMGPCKVLNSPSPGEVVGGGMINISPDLMLHIPECEFLQVTPVG
ncbi:MAG TPA: hypothetical protein PLD54_04220, partial [Candidatus Levybacteria bacterium]|nr:hypothetical protein [Candidatus Levybacteria bacterium]